MLKTLLLDAEEKMRSRCDEGEKMPGGEKGPKNRTGPRKNLALIIPSLLCRQKSPVLAGRLEREEKRILLFIGREGDQKKSDFNGLIVRRDNGGLGLKSQLLLLAGEKKKRSLVSRRNGAMQTRVAEGNFGPILEGRGTSAFTP